MIEKILHLFKTPFEDPIVVFVLFLLIILLSPLILQKLKIPGIVGLIIAGVIIGPYGLHLVNNNSAMELFSTIGLIYIMFVVGLELDINDFYKNRNKSVIYTIINLIIPPACFFPICYLGLGYSITACLLLSSMLVTHTLLSYPIVSKMRATRDEAVIVTVGGTVLIDTLALVLLVLIMEYEKGITFSFIVSLFFSISVYLVTIFWLVPALTTRVFKKINHDGYATYIYVLLVVFVSSLFAHVAGLEPIIGAFVAGLALNRHIPHSSVLMNRIDFVGNAIFIPFFLISVGMLVNVRAILSGTETIILASVLTVIGIGSKWAASFISQKIFHYTSNQRRLMFGLSSARAAATLAIALVGYNAGFLSEVALNATVILILVTCIVATFVTELSAKKVAVELKEKEKSTIRTMIQDSQHILIPIANVDYAPFLLEFALLIKEHNNAYPISLLSVIANDKDAEVKQIKVKRRLQEVANSISAVGKEVHIQTTIGHNIPSAIARISRELLSDTIILGWPGHVSMLDRMMGEIFDNILYSTDKTNIVCLFRHQLASHKRLVVIVPHYAEYEQGFQEWLSIIARLSRELSLNVTFKASMLTCEAIKVAYKEMGITLNFVFMILDAPEDISVYGKDIKTKDLICIITSRKGYMSYNRSLGNLPMKIEKYFDNNSRLIIYPHQGTDNN